MPHYEYLCQTCGHRFEAVVTLHEHERGRKAPCPKCQSTKVQQRPSVFQAVTSQKG